MSTGMASAREHLEHVEVQTLIIISIEHVLHTGDA